MSSVLKLVKMIQKEVLPDIEEHMDEMCEIVADKNATEEDKDELRATQELKKEFEELLEDLQEGELNEEEILECIAEIEEMRKIEDE